MTDPKPLPTAYPLESKVSPPALQVRADKGALGAPNTGGSTSTAVHAGPRISRRRLVEIESHLSERDMTLLQSVDRFRFLTANQIQTLHFAAHASSASGARTCRRVLARLRSLRILGVLDRRIGGVRAGSEGLVYYVDTAGERLQRGSRPGRKRQRFDEPSARFLNHTLAIASVAAQIIAASRDMDVEVVTIAPEQFAARPFTDQYGVAQVLRPDLYVELAATVGGEEVSAYFVEVDLGHESLPTLMSKALAYESYRSTGVEQDRYGGFPRVVWGMDAFRTEVAERRRTTLERSFAQNSRITPGLNRVDCLPMLAAVLMKGLRHD